MKGTEKQVEFAKSIIAARTDFAIDLSSVMIGGDWRTGDDGREPTDEEVAALSRVIEQIGAIDCASAVISTKGRTLKNLLKSAESTISTQFPIMNKDEFIASLNKDDVLLASELIRAL